MVLQRDSDDRRAQLDDKLSELMLCAKELCPEAMIEVSTLQYEDEDGHVRVFPPPTLSQEEERLEMALCTRAGEIFDTTGLFILCAVFDAPPR